MGYKRMSCVVGCRGCGATMNGLVSQPPHELCRHEAYTSCRLRDHAASCVCSGGKLEPWIFFMGCSGFVSDGPAWLVNGFGSLTAGKQRQVVCAMQP